MKVKELIKELMDGHLEDEIKIKLISVSMPDGKTYISNIEGDVAIDLNESEIVLTSSLTSNSKEADSEESLTWFIWEYLYPKKPAAQN